MKGWEVLKEFILANEIKYVFGNPGTTETTFLSALTQCSSLDYILSLQESSTIGMAAGYAMATKKSALVNVHTYPGLANSMCNLFNALTSGIPLMVTAGQQDRRHLVHHPILSGNLTGLVETAVKYAAEVNRIEDFSILLQRCYVQSMLPPAGPTFLSIPMDILDDEVSYAEFKKTTIKQASSVGTTMTNELLHYLKNTPEGKLVFIADYEVGLSQEGMLALEELAQHLGADIYAGSYHVRSVISKTEGVFKGHLPVFSSDINKILSRYDTIVLLGAKLPTFLFTGESSMPKNKKFIQVSSSSHHLGFDYACDLCVVGDVGAILTSLVSQLGISKNKTLTSKNKFETTKDELQKMGKTAMIIHAVLACLSKTTPIVTEGSSEDSVIQKLALEFSFQDVHFSPRGGGLGWAMPVAAGIGLATKQPVVCFVGDGGSLYAIHTLWSAVKYKIPLIVICFINQEYRILKNLWCREKGSDINQTKFIGMDLEPPINFIELAHSFGAITTTIESSSEVSTVMQKALTHPGPSFIGVLSK